MPVRFGLFALALAALAPASAAAADAKGRFAADGAGAAPCPAYLQAREDGGADYRLFAGWIDGYISGLNHLRPDTYDLTAWRTTEVLAAMAAQYCQARKDARFIDAVNEIVLALEPDRLTGENRIMRVRRGDQAVLLYKGVVARIVARLVALGLLDAGSGDGFGETEARALAQFQRRHGLPASGLPDQRTLLALLQ